MDREKYRRLFIEEARESLRSFGNDLVSLEKKPDARDVMDSAFRTAHSLKGMGAAMGYTRFAELAHRLEDLADIARQGGVIGQAGFDLLLEGSDSLEDMVERVAAGDEAYAAENAAAVDLAARVASTVSALKQPTAPGGTSAPVSSAATSAGVGSASVTAGSTSAGLGSASVAPGSAQAASASAQSASAGAAAALTDAAVRPHESSAKLDATSAGLLSVRVKIADDASLPQVRAFVVHKALAGLPGYRETEPHPDSLRTKELPNRTLIVRFEPSLADAALIEKTARNQQGVADVVVGEPLAPIAAAPEKAPTGEDDRTVRVRTALLDDLLDSVGELLLARSRIRALASKTDMPELGDLVDEVERLTKDLHGRVVAARMTPLAFITERFPRVVRDLARSSKKTVDFQMHGTEIELDRAILDELSAPFLHMLRNAVDHAHEGDDVRKANGKPVAMKLQLKASRERDTVLLELEDNGGGMDPERIRRRAVERGLISADAANALSDGQALELICLPGFSTVEQVSQTSGRGVGMDVVKATLERLGGTLSIESSLGKGTRLILQLPLTVAIIQVLVVEAGDAYAIPVTRVEQAIDLEPSGVSTAHGKTYMKHGASLVPLFDLSKELGYTVDAKQSGTVILVGRGPDVTALRVDAILGQEEVVAKPLGPPLSALGYLAGATLLADGRAAFILEPLRLVQPL